MNEKYCANCDKMIFPTPLWTYKVKEDVKTYWYCSWSCFNNRKIYRKRVYKKKYED